MQFNIFINKTFGLFIGSGRMRRPAFSFAFREERKNSVRPLYPFPSCTIFAPRKVRLAMKKCLVALAFGTLGLGMSEFGMMGILTFVASGLHVSIPQAGHLVSAYALGVCIGAPLTVAVAHTRPLKQILLALAGLMVAGNLCAAFAPNYGVLLAMRFVSGLPHGAYFGVGSIVGGTGSRSGPERTGRGGDDRRHDGGQSLRRAAGNAGQPPVVVAGTVLHRRRLGCGDGFFPLTLGTVDGACGRQPRIEGAVRLPAESGRRGSSSWRRCSVMAVSSACTVMSAR